MVDPDELIFQRMKVITALLRSLVMGVPKSLWIVAESRNGRGRGRGWGRGLQESWPIVLARFSCRIADQAKTQYCRIGTQAK